MPAYEVECDIEQGFAAAERHRRTVGYLTALGDVVPDLLVTMPPPETAQPVVAVLSGAGWSTTATGDLTLCGRLSTANAALLPTLTAGALVRLSFVVFAFDPANGVHYRAFESYRGYAASGVGRPGVVYGVLAKATAEEWTISPAPGPQQQQIMIHPSVTTKLILPWGR